MRKIILALLGCVTAVVVLGIVVWHGDQAPPPGPRLDIETIRHDFGRVRSGTVVHHDFEMRNDRADPRLITSVATTCGCTTVGANMPQVIAPHSTAVLPVDMNLKGAGPFQSNVYVAFNDESSITATLSGEAVQQYPPELKFENVRPGEAAEQRFVVRSMSDKPLHVKSLQCDGHDFEAFVVTPAATTRPDDPEIVVRFRPTVASGARLTSSLRVETDDDVQPLKVLKLQANLLGPVETK